MKVNSVFPNEEGPITRCAATLLMAATVLAFTATTGAWAQRQDAGPIVPEGMPKQLSAHVWMITSFPNIGIVVGNRATLVVDTGLGKRNGQTVAREAKKLSKSDARLYLTTTHFHPEHSSGDEGFPADTIIVRNIAQQKEIEEQGKQTVEGFRGRNQQFHELLEGQKFRPTDVVFDREARIDLGGVTARLLWYGGAHTVGDELIFIEPDDVLISGDVVQNKVVPGAAADSTFKSWQEVVKRIQSLPVKIVVPDHSAVGDASLVTQELAFLTDLETLTADAKREGKSADDAAASVSDTMKRKYVGWSGLDGLLGMVKRVYAEQ
jgi:glyoxylase-like metal-dependent hydrolase (beta-lactamase superfamily II)